MKSTNSEVESVEDSWDELAEDVEALWLRWYTLLFRKYALLFLVYVLFVWGVLVLVGRMWLGGWSRWFVLPGLLTVGGVWMARRMAHQQMPDARAMYVWLDDLRGQGGLYMAQTEVDMGHWERRVSHQQPIPELRWKGRFLGSVLLVACCFLLMASWIPDRWLHVRGRAGLDIDDQIVQLNKRIATLKKQRILTPKQAKEWQKQVKAIKRQARANDPARTLQSLDHMEQQTRRMAAKAMEQAMAQMGRWSRTKRMAKALQKQGHNMSPAFRKEALKRLSSRLSQNMRQSRKMSASARNALKQSMQGGMKQGGHPQRQMTPQQARAFARHMRSLSQQSLTQQQTLSRFMRSIERSGMLSKQMKQLSQQMRKQASLSQQGNHGKQGNQGRQGQQGKQGKQGNQGKQGRQGNQGQQGQQGRQGNQGNQGNQGQGKGHNPNQGGQGQGKGQGQGQGKGQGKGQSQNQGKGSQTGRGAGVSRGGGRSELTWKAKSQMTGLRFRVIKLPRAKVRKMRSYAFGFGTAPARKRRRGQTGRVRAGGLWGAKTNKSGAYTHPVEPRYWGTVKRYFKRGKGGQTP